MICCTNGVCVSTVGTATRNTIKVEGSSNRDRKIVIAQDAIAVDGKLLRVRIKSSYTSQFKLQAMTPRQPSQIKLNLSQLFQAQGYLY